MTHPKESHWKSPGEGGSRKPKHFKGKNEAKLEFSDGWWRKGGTNKKNLLWEGYGYFSEPQMVRRNKTKQIDGLKKWQWTRL